MNKNVLLSINQIMNMHFNYNRVPRKYKKKWRSVFSKFHFLELNQIIWYITYKQNPSHINNLIKNIINGQHTRSSSQNF